MEAELPKLNNTFMANWYTHEISRIKRVYGLIKKANLKNLGKNFTLNDVKHAFIAVASRNFRVSLKKEKRTYNCLAPYTDMFNFDPQENTKWVEEIQD